MAMRLYDTATQAVVPFEPGPVVRMYVCGITPYDSTHLGHAAVYLVHDVLITAGIFVLFGWEVNLQVLAALLVVIGYSLNDTIVIYDRIRENLEVRGTTHLEDVVNQSINQTLSRTLLTSMTTLAVVVANRHHEALSGLTDDQNIYFAKQPCSAGILEAIEHYHFLDSCEIAGS